MSEAPAASTVTETPSASKLTARIAIANTFVGNLSAAICFSLIAPFFPTEAYKKGLSSTVVGVIFGIFQVVIAISSPVFGAYMTKIGSRFMYLFGMFLCGAMSVAFGCMEYINGAEVYATLCIAIRIVNGIGASMLFTACYATCAYLFPQNVGVLFGALETSLGVGLMVGPVFGGLLFDSGGFKLPFFVLGAYLMAATAISVLVFPKITNQETKSKNGYMKALKIPVVSVLCGSVALGALGLGFIEPILEPQIRRVDPQITAVLVGVIFMAGSLCYAVTMPLIGHVADKTQRGVEIMLAGVVFLSLALLITGPAPFLRLSPSTWLLCVGLALLVIGVVATSIPAFSEILNTLFEHGFKNDLDSQGLVSGLFNCMWATGIAVGPPLGGWLNEMVGFTYACVTLAGVVFGIGTIALSPVVVMRARRRRLAQMTAKATEQDEAFIKPDSLNEAIDAESLKLTPDEDSQIIA